MLDYVLTALLVIWGVGFGLGILALISRFDELESYAAREESRTDVTRMG